MNEVLCLCGFPYVIHLLKVYSGVSDYIEKVCALLHDIIEDTDVTYDDLRKYTIRTDRDPNNSENIILIYSKDSVNGSWDGGKTWNREHVWPQSKGWFTTSGAGSDIHHLRPEALVVIKLLVLLLMDIIIVLKIHLKVMLQELFFTY